jgi:hypothetical protein
LGTWIVEGLVTPPNVKWGRIQDPGSIRGVALCVPESASNVIAKTGWEEGTRDRWFKNVVCRAVVKVCGIELL